MSRHHHHGHGMSTARCSGRGVRADRRFHARGVRRRHPRAVARPDGRRRPHADRRGRAGARLGSDANRDASCRSTSLFRISATASARDLRQRLRAAVHRRVDRNRSRAAAVQSGARRMRSDPLGRRTGPVREPDRLRDAAAGRRARHEHLGGDVARVRRLARLGGSRARGCRHPVHRLAADRSAVVACWCAH